MPKAKKKTLWGSNQEKYRRIKILYPVSKTVNSKSENFEEIVSNLLKNYHIITPKRLISAAHVSICNLQNCYVELLPTISFKS